MLAYLDCFSGISGDMLLGALLDAGLDLEALRTGLASLPLARYTLTVEPVTEHGVSGMRARVLVDGLVDGSAPQEHRRLAEVEAILNAGGLPERARETALVVFRRLAAAEAAIHGTTPQQVTFHEVGAVDSLVDIAGAALGLELLGVTEIYCSELPLTSGRVTSAHGALPVPAPATVELLKETGAMWRPVPTEGELVTPTGAAILATLARFERPALTMHSVGYGFGSRKLPWANCLRVVLGLSVGEAPALAGRESAKDFERDEIVVIETNVDNMTGEALGWLMDRLLDAGALDVTYAPLHMKKNRPGTLLSVLAAPDNAQQLAALLLRESGTLGVRMRHEERMKAGRRSEEIETPLGTVRVKLKLIGGAVVAISPEYEDCRALAAHHDLPVEVVMARVTHAARAHFGLGGD